MTQPAYVPMRGPEKQVSQEEMWEKLARHAKPKIEINPQAVATPKAELRTLEWLPPVKTGRLSGYVLTRCGTYSISKDVGMDDFITYTGWRRKTEKADAVMLGIRTARIEAERLCTLDANR